MYDIISLKGLTAFGTHGVYDFEQSQPQPFVVDIALWIDISAAAQSDDVNQTVSYADVARDVCAIVEGPSVHLIETLADRIALCLMTHPKVAGVQVVVHKPEAPMEQNFTDVSVAVRRGYTDPARDIEGTPALVHPQEVSESLNESANEPQAMEEVPTAAITPEEPIQETAPQKEDLEQETASGQPRRDVHSPDFPFPSRRAAAHLTSPDQWRNVVLAFGGNVGNVPATLASALDVLETVEGLEITEVSPLLRTHAVLKPGMEAQDDHWNMVAIGRTNLSAHRLLKTTSDLESVLGRERPFEWAPRAIDIDIIAVGDEHIEDEVIQIPHPRAHSRAFVLVPWLMVDPQAVLPGHGSVAELAQTAEDRFGIVDVIEDWRSNALMVMSESDAMLSLDEHSSADTAQDDAAVAQIVDTADVVPSDLEHDASDEAFTVDEDGQVSADSAGETFLLDVPTPDSQPLRRNFAAEWEDFVKTVSFDTTDVADEQLPVEPVIVPQLAQDPVPYAEESLDLPLEQEMPVIFTVPEPEYTDFSPVRSAPLEEDPKIALSPSEERQYEAPSFDDVLTSELTRPVDAHVSWIPVSAAMPVVTEQNDTSLVVDREFISDTLDEQDSTPVPVPSADSMTQRTSLRAEERPLPSWNFSRTPVTVIDSIDEVDSPLSEVADEELAGYEEDPQVVADAFAPPSAEIILDPQLPEDTQVGIVSSPQTPVSGVSKLAAMSRKSVFRPTHTGAIPVVKRSE